MIGFCERVKESKERKERERKITEGFGLSGKALIYIQQQ
jgi:hypothetical protein